MQRLQSCDRVWGDSVVAHTGRETSPLLEIALVLVLDHVASRIVNADHGIM